MKLHEQWKRDVRSMGHSTAAISGALAPVWIIKYAGAAYRDGKISLVERDEMFANAKCMMSGEEK